MKTFLLAAAVLLRQAVVYDDGTVKQLPDVDLASGGPIPVTTSSTTTVTTTTTLRATTTSTTLGATTSTTLPPGAGLPLSAPFMGLVHESVCDTANAQPGLQQGWWSRQCSGGPCAIGGAPYSCNQWEVPLMFEAPAWNAPLATITSTMQGFFAQNPNIAIFQLGWEENIKGRCCSSAQLATIDQQFAAVKQARTNAGGHAKLAYQLVWQTLNPYDGSGTNLFNDSSPSVQAFLAPTSPAPRDLDYIAVHPYVWRNWPNPDMWVPQMMAQLKAWIAASQNPGLQVIWTEGGATVCDTSTAGCTCMEGSATVRAMPQWEHADFWLKAQVLGLANGVKKIAWYSGSTDGTCTAGSSCESSCFGLNSATGRQTHTAYSVLTHCMGNATAVAKVVTAPPPFEAYDFTVPGGHCIVAWTYQPGTTQVVQPTSPAVVVPVGTLTGGRPATSVVSKLGAALSTSSVTLTPSPVFIRTP